MKLQSMNTEFKQVVLLIEESRNRAFQKVNEELVMLYYKVGNLVSDKVSNGVWGEKTVDELADFIQENCPGLKGFNRRGLYRMKQFYETYSSHEFVSILNLYLQNPDNQFSTIVSTPVTQLSAIENKDLQIVTPLVTQINWANHLLILSKTKSAEEKIFYLINCITQKFSKRELERQLNTAAFERTMLYNKLVVDGQSKIPEGLFKDPYIFEFLDIPDTHSEKDLEKALVINLQKFILEIGKGFTYMGNQYRLQVGNKDYFTDLLFYHRDLQCLVLFELKITEFEPEFLGILNFYLEALDRNVKRPFENPSIGILLCKGKDTEVVEYAMARSTSAAIIADYETKLIPKSVLAKKLHQLVERLSNG
jgi:predicted nuclease of restriction endonuclease-like (RecB) superfamily